MYAAHASQKDVLLLFRADLERFRLAPHYAVGAPANGGNLYYERFEWGMTGTRWLQLAETARAELVLARVA